MDGSVRPWIHVVLGRPTGSTNSSRFCHDEYITSTRGADALVGFPLQLFQPNIPIGHLAIRLDDQAFWTLWTLWTLWPFLDLAQRRRRYSELRTRREGIPLTGRLRGRRRRDMQSRSHSFG